MLHEMDLSRADLNLLVLFEAVLREGHVGRAAESLHLSPSAVSHGLGRLRRLLGDPVFLRAPKGVVPTASALDLAAPIAEVLAGARRVLATAQPFDPATSTRAFLLGVPDGATSFLLPLLDRLAADAPGLDLRLRQLLPTPSAEPPGNWEAAWADLDARALDLAIGPFAEIPARFAASPLREEDFVVVARPGHPFAQAPTLDAYCGAAHLVTSQTGDPLGFVDMALAQRGLARRVALTVPSFFMALAVAAATDLLVAVPRSLARTHGAGLAIREPPLPLPRFTISAVLPRAALGDAGLAWLLGTLATPG
ncbi:MAG TPA: LysR family transcriptional regulator [Rubellimicrobium sp.]|nr:LysR family transcriptional regulator [Rubellimicrobium sp.]